VSTPFEGNFFAKILSRDFIATSPTFLSSQKWIKLGFSEPPENGKKWQLNVLFIVGSNFSV
jgi:hypothetical protein